MKYISKCYENQTYLHIHGIASTKTSNNVPRSDGLKINQIKSVDFKPRKKKGKVKERKRKGQQPHLVERSLLS